ncbi:MAG: rod shape-determining protein MreC [Gemmatimonadetes bacterium]|nr:rod shape-determining protein MreC [Gemmatimonadota bacterium]
MADFGGSRRERRRDAAIAIAVLVLAFLLLFLPLRWTRPVRQAIRNTIVRPFVATQAWVASRRAEREDLAQVKAQRDSLAAVATAQSVLAEENARLRALLGIAERGGPALRPARVLRLGVATAESTFLIDAGSEDGVTVGSPVFTADGLVGVVAEVSARSAQAIDWTNAEFRASGMTADGQVYGVVEPRRGAFRELDQLVMTGAPFHSDVRPGRRIVTSGRGGLFPRGIPLGVVVGIEEADTGWRKSYVLQPAARPESALAVLVGLDVGADLGSLWEVVPRDEARAAAALPEGPGPGR